MRAYKYLIISYLFIIIVITIYLLPPDSFFIIWKICLLVLAQPFNFYSKFKRSIFERLRKAFNNKPEILSYV